MNSKLKSKILAALFAMPEVATPGDRTSGQTLRSSTTLCSDEAPAIRGSRHEQQRRQQTLENEQAREELRKHGIKVRDFQVEVDARKRHSAATPTTKRVDSTH
ncbi:uncharacterized protein PV06_07319 [Exophiala oligosperma]|uniref:Uncharacterized protein n=1 Tax=Exophiala oligosperma TaxID=215243 RepID=A0A0D2DAF8_9EURO|nr:uncharacterized protein PV06_07319 [Exophiala oligosperma]KIW40083.1 hypothetical protein PV06_07319 [Exophiala oligosperma]